MTASNEASTTVMGKDRLGWIYAIQLAEYVRVLRTSQSRIIANCSLAGQRICRMLDRLELSMFNAMT